MSSSAVPPAHRPGRDRPAHRCQRRRHQLPEAGDGSPSCSCTAQGPASRRMPTGA
jgi:hypothetical protein